MRKFGSKSYHFKRQTSITECRFEQRRQKYVHPKQRWSMFEASIAIQEIFEFYSAEIQISPLVAR